VLQLQVLSQVSVPVLPSPQVRVAFGAHVPSPEHAPNADQVPVLVSHVRVCVPVLQLPHIAVAEPAHAITGSTHVVLQLHVLSQASVPALFVPHIRVELGAHVPPPEHAPKADQLPVVVSHVRVSVPLLQLPQLAVAEPLHCITGVTQVVLQLHVLSQVCVPALFAPHVRVAEGAQVPPPEHAPYADQFPVVVSHVRVSVPLLQLPQLAVGEPLHCITGVTQVVLQLHVLSQVSVPALFAPHVRVAEGAHVPPPEHAPYADH
jgi:hypothetical protein